MGLFDYFRSSYDLGPDFTDVLCQTKDIDDSGIGGSMDEFWVDPAGVLWRLDFGGTHTLEFVEEGDPRYVPDRPFLNHTWEPTGRHGRVVHHPLTKYVEVYHADWKGDWQEWPRCRLHFRDGVLQDFTDFTLSQKP